MKAQSALSVKEANLKAMTAFIYTQGSATKQMFEHELGLSLPTITQNMRAMEADGSSSKGEMQQSHRWTQSANLRIRGTLQRGDRRAHPNHTNHGHRH